MNNLSDANDKPIASQPLDKELNFPSVPVTEVLDKFQKPIVPVTAEILDKIQKPIVPVTAELLDNIQKPIVPPTEESLSSVISSLKKITDPKIIKTPFYFEILEYILPNNLPNKSFLVKGTKIQIIENNYYLIINGIREKNIPHQDKLIFGREGHINFELYDVSISRKQFEILLEKDSAKIICQCTPPKIPTSILMTNEPFYLSEGNIISFGKQGDFIFTVHAIDNNYIDLQQITFAKQDQRLKNIFNIQKKNRECILGSFAPLNIPFIKDCNIKIGFDYENEKWYLVLDKLQDRKFSFGCHYETFVWIFNHQLIPKENKELPSKIESFPVELKESMIINIGGCYLKVRSGMF